MLRRPIRSRRNRRQFDPSNVPHGTPVVGVLSASAPNVLLTLSSPCSLNGIPAVKRAGVLPVTASMLTPTQVQLTFSVTSTAGIAFTLPANDPAVRSANGGYVNPLAFTFP